MTIARTLPRRRLCERRRYRYSDVPEGVFRRFLAAESKGRYFNEEIRDRFTFTYDVE